MKADDLPGEMIAATVERASFGIVICDPSQDDTPIVYVNDGFQKITRYSREEAVGRNCRFLQGEGTSEAEVARMRDAIARGEEFSGRLVNYKSDGTPFLNELSIAPVLDEEGEVVTAYFGVQRELDDEDEDVGVSGSERPAHATSHAVMLREIQHRVKNHLSMVVSLIRLQARRPITRESYVALSHRIEALALLYDELLQPVHSNNGEVVSAGAYLSRVATVIAGLDGRPSIRLNVDCDELELPIDPAARLGLLLTELLTNAFGHAFEGREKGYIGVHLHEKEGRVLLVVEDDGVGLPEGSDWPRESESVSKQRERAETEEGELDTTSHGKSSGLGGSIVRGLTKALDAKLDVQSGEDGTRITVDINPHGPVNGTPV